MAFITITDAMDLLKAEARALMVLKGERVKGIQLCTNFAEDTVDLRVVHTLFYRYELTDGSYKQFFRRRYLEAILARYEPLDEGTLIVKRPAVEAAAPPKLARNLEFEE